MASTGSAEAGLRLMLAGDAILVRPWSESADPRFMDLVQAMRDADVTILNLETLIHAYGGYAQAQSGGTWVASPPPIARELAWAGVDMVAHANNHAFDYGSLGVLENLANVSAAGLLLAGSGPDLQAARAPARLHHPRGRVALVAATTSLVPFGRASRSRPELRGRPGVNPLEVVSHTEVSIPPSMARRLRRLSRALGLGHASRFDFGRFRLGGLAFRVAGRHALARGPRLREDDCRGNLAAVEAAAADADVAVLSIHAHRQGPWLRRFAHAAIARGAHVVFVHGPHAVGGVELHRGRPIFYGLGDFVYQTHHIERLPSEYFERFGLEGEASQETVARVEAHVAAKPEVWQGMAPRLELRRGRVVGIELLPVDLGWGEPPGTRGLPRRATGGLARQIIDRVARRSRRYGTRIRYVEGPEAGRVELEPSAPR